LEPTCTASFLFELEKKLLRQYKTYKNIEPRPVKIVEADDFNGTADDDFILISAKFLKSNPTVKEITDLLKHELLHYVCDREGHNLNFCAKAAKMKVAGDYEYSQLLSEANKSWLEGRLSIKINEQGEEELIDHKRPSFNRFRDFIMDAAFPVGKAYQGLREINNLSVCEVSKRSGISEDEIMRIETGDFRVGMLFTNEATLKKVFKAIVGKPCTRVP
jgi:hypothetical protein